MKKFLLLLILFSASSAVLSQVTWPAVNRATRPWARWWWQGSAVDSGNITRSLEAYKAAGLGGLEITPIYGVQGYEQQFVEYLSPQWMQLLGYTLREAKRLNLGIDMANGTGWPFGGPWITEKEASKTVAYKIYELNAGESLKEKITYYEEGFVRTANNQPLSLRQLVRPVAANKNLQALAIDQVKYAGLLALKVLMGYSDKGAVVDLTAKVNTAGNLSWAAPGGKWTLYALFEGLHGKLVERAAPGGEGYAIDHFSAAALKQYLVKFDEAFRGHDLSSIRALFNDSYEVDDARGQANWTPDLFRQFRKRRGYDLKQHLPALFAKDSNEISRRVIYDYRATIDELILENFTMAWKKWGTAKGALIRNQSHGSPANLLDLYGAIDIPETEGNDILRFKFATSAANVTGKKLASSESATWLNEHFLSSWGDVKKAVDLFFLGGVNHIFYHGVNYSPSRDTWPGWLFYAAVHFHPSNPQWRHFPTLNQYVTRAQSFLQQGQPDNDVLVYFPLPDRYAQPGRELLQHFDGMERQFEGTGFEHASRWMLEHGYGFDFFSDRQLQQFEITGNRIATGGNRYQAILLPGNRLIPEGTMQKLLDLARKGARIVVYKNLPDDVPGLARLESRRKTLAGLMAQLIFTENAGVRKAVIGKGQVWAGDDLQTLLEAAGVRSEQLHEHGLQAIRRRQANGYTWFISNRTDRLVEQWVTLSQPAASYALFNPMSGENGLARSRIVGNKTELYLSLKPFETLIVRSHADTKRAVLYPYIHATAAPVALTGSWTIEFLEGGPVLPQKSMMHQPRSWTELDGLDVKNFSGLAKYSVTFQKPAGMATSWLLDLGRVEKTAEVRLNGKKLATLIGPGFQVVIHASQWQDTNRLEVIVANLMANRISYMDRSGIGWKKFYNINMSARLKENAKNGVFDASFWQPLPSGLLGPVTLQPLSKHPNAAGTIEKGAKPAASASAEEGKPGKRTRYPSEQPAR